jgi:hypothetical protein
MDPTRPPARLLYRTLSREQQPAGHLRSKLKLLVVGLLAVVLATFSARSASAATILWGGQWLAPGQSITSEN